MQPEGLPGEMTHRRIALGIAPHLDAFALVHDAESWKQFAKDHPNNWKKPFFNLMNDPTVAVFLNLEGIDPWPSAARAAQRRGGATDWELFQIQQNPSWWPRIRWIKRGVPVPNPFD